MQSDSRPGRCDICHQIPSATSVLRATECGYTVCVRCAESSLTGDDGQFHATDEAVDRVLARLPDDVLAVRVGGGPEVVFAATAESTSSGVSAARVTGAGDG